MTGDQSWKGVYKSGGFSLFAGGAILVIFLLSVFIFRVALPLTPQAVLENPMPPITLYLLAAPGELLLLPTVLGLYLSLKHVKELYADSRCILVSSCNHVSRLPRPDHIPPPYKRQIRGRNQRVHEGSLPGISGPNH
jgi:hypothetical protein